MKEKLTNIFLALFLLLSLLPAKVPAAEIQASGSAVDLSTYAAGTSLDDMNTVVIRSDCTVTGTAKNFVTLKITGGGTRNITFDGVVIQQPLDIESTSGSQYTSFPVRIENNTAVNLTVKGTSLIRVATSQGAALGVQSGSSLKVSGTGTLTAAVDSNSYAPMCAGIGWREYERGCGDITIAGGTVNVSCASLNGRAIGSPTGSGSVSVSGGTLNIISGRAGFSENGTFNVSGGALNLTNGSDTSYISGCSAFIVSGGTADLKGGLISKSSSRQSDDYTPVTLNGGSISGTGMIAVGGGSIPAGASAALNISASVKNTLKVQGALNHASGKTMNNTGIIDVTGTLTNSGSLNNGSAGIINISGSGAKMSNSGTVANSGHIYTISGGQYTGAAPTGTAVEDNTPVNALSFSPVPGKAGMQTMITAVSPSLASGNAYACSVADSKVSMPPNGSVLPSAGTAPYTPGDSVYAQTGQYFTLYEYESSGSKIKGFACVRLTEAMVNTTAAARLSVFADTAGVSENGSTHVSALPDYTGTLYYTVSDSAPGAVPQNITLPAGSQVLGDGIIAGLQGRWVTLYAASETGGVLRVSAAGSKQVTSAEVYHFTGGVTVDTEQKTVTLPADSKALFCITDTGLYEYENPSYYNTFKAIDVLDDSGNAVKLSEYTLLAGVSSTILVSANPLPFAALRPAEGAEDSAVLVADDYAADAVDGDGFSNCLLLNHRIAAGTVDISGWFDGLIQEHRFVTTAQIVVTEKAPFTLEKNASLHLASLAEAVPMIKGTGAALTADRHVIFPRVQMAFFNARGEAADAIHSGEDFWVKIALTDWSDSPLSSEALALTASEKAAGYSSCDWLDPSSSNYPGQEDPDSVQLNISHYGDDVDLAYFLQKLSAEKIATFHIQGTGANGPLHLITDEDVPITKVSLDVAYRYGADIVDEADFTQNISLLARQQETLSIVKSDAGVPETAGLTLTQGDSITLKTSGGSGSGTVSWSIPAADAKKVNLVAHNDGSATLYAMQPTDSGSITVTAVKAGSGSGNDAFAIAEAVMNGITVKKYQPEDAGWTADLTPNAAGWYSSDITLTRSADMEAKGWLLSASSDGSKAADTLTVSAPSKAGSQSIYAVKDMVGTVLAVELDSFVYKLDKTAPSKPTLSVTAQADDTTVTLTAAAADDIGVASYTLAETNSRIAEQTSTDGLFRLTGLTPDTAYSFTVTAADYAGLKSVVSDPCTFSTLKPSLAEAEVTLSTESFIYTGTAQTPSVTVKIGDATLESGQYSITYKDSNGSAVSSPTAAGTYTVFVTAAGSGSFSGTAKSQPAFTIERAAPDNGTVSYNGGIIFNTTPVKNIRLTFSNYTVTGWLLLDDGVKLSAGTDEYSWKFIPADTANYKTVTGTVSLTVTADTLASLEISGSPDKTSYIYGETFATDGLIVTAVYSSGNTMSVTDKVTSGTLHGGDTAVTLTYSEGSVSKTCVVSGLSVTRQQLSLSGMSWGSSSFVYDGSVHGMTLDGTLPEGVDVVKTGDTAIGAGDYTASASFALAAGYDARDYEITGTNPLIKDWSISTAAVPGAKDAGTELVYTSIMTQTLTASDFGITMAGSFTANGAVSDSGNVLASAPVYGTDVQYALQSGLSFSSQTIVIPVTFTPDDTNYAPVNLEATVTLTERDIIAEAAAAQKAAQEAAAQKAAQEAAAQKAAQEAAAQKAAQEAAAQKAAQEAAALEAAKLNIPRKVKKFKTKPLKKGYVSVTWKKDKKALRKYRKINGYDVQVFADSSYTRIVFTGHYSKYKTKFTFKGQKKTRYWFRIRYTGSDGGHSAWVTRQVMTKKK